MAHRSQQTFGIELEFLVFFVRRDWPVPAADDERYGPVLRMPPSIPIPRGFEYTENHPFYIKHLQGEWVRQKVADVITAAGFESRTSHHRMGSHPSLFGVWNVVPDDSLGLPWSIDRALRPLETVGVEINSPVFEPGEAAFREIATVVKAIKSAFRVAVPPICGFHVHVGRDRLPLKLRHVQRAACFLWLAEDLIDTLHAGCRLGNSHCRSMRRFSNLAEDILPPSPLTSMFCRCIRSLVNMQHAEVSFDRVDKQRKKPTDYRYTRPVSAITGRDPGSLFGVMGDSTPSQVVATDYTILRVTAPSMDALYGVGELLRAASVATVTDLVSSPHYATAYNFENLRFPLVRKPTIEFRQAAGSLDEDWIVLWAKICLALSGPRVADSSDDDFFQLLHGCVRAEGDPAAYDVFDLLHDVGLRGEDIDAVHRRLVSGRYELEPVLLFHRPDDGLGFSRYDEFGTAWYDRARRGDNDYTASYDGDDERSSGDAGAVLTSTDGSSDGN